MQSEIESGRFSIGPYTFTIVLNSADESSGDRTVHILEHGRRVLSRVFYYGAASRHIHSFAKKFASDGAYRALCLSGSARWARVNLWYERNEPIYRELLITLREAATPYEQRARAAQIRRATAELRRFYKLLDKQLDALEGSQAYQAHLRQAQPAPVSSEEHTDDEVAPLIGLLDNIRGVQVASYCRGLRSGIAVDWWPHGPIWCPDRHEPYAFIRFTHIPATVARPLDWALRRAGAGRLLQNEARASTPAHNVQFFEVITTVLDEGWF